MVENCPTCGRKNPPVVPEGLVPAFEIQHCGRTFYIHPAERKLLVGDTRPEFVYVDPKLVEPNGWLRENQTNWLLAHQFHMAVETCPDGEFVTPVLYVEQSFMRDLRRGKKAWDMLTRDVDEVYTTAEEAQHLANNWLDENKSC